MTIEEAIRFFGSGSAVAKALQVTRATVSRWKVSGYIPPGQQLFLEKISDGKLKAEATKPTQEYKLTPKALDLKATQLYEALAERNINLSYQSCREIIVHDYDFRSIEQFNEYWSQRGEKIVQA